MSDARRWWPRIAVAVTLLLGLFFRFDHLAGKEFWEDEVLGRVHALGYTEAQIVVASPSFTHVADLQRYLDIGPEAGALPPVQATIASLAVEDPQHPPVFYVLAHWWTQAFGGGPAAVRFLPAFFGVVAIGCIALLAYELFGSLTVAMVAATLLAVSPFFVLYAQEAREYSLWTVVILFDGYVLLRALRRPSIGLWAAYAATTALALYVDPLTALVTAGWFVYAIGCSGWRIGKPVIGCALASCAALAAFAPWAYVMHTSSGLGRGMAGILTQRLSLGTIATLVLRNLRLVFFDFGLFRLGPIRSEMINGVLTIAVLILTAYAFVRLVRANGFKVWGFVVVGLCAPMSLLVIHDLVMHGRFVYQMRYFTPAIAGMILALADLARPGDDRLPSVLRRPTWTTPAIGTLIVGGIISCALSAGATTWWNKDYEESRSVSAAVATAHDPVLISDYDADSVLALAYNLQPDVAVRLNLRCAQCALPDPPRRNLMTATPDGPIFVLDDVPPGEADNSARHAVRYIDPHPFPQQLERLSMFQHLPETSTPR